MEIPMTHGQSMPCPHSTLTEGVSKWVSACQRRQKPTDGTEHPRNRPDLRRPGLEALRPETSGGRETAPICGASVGSGLKGGVGVGETNRDSDSGGKEGKGYLELGVTSASVGCKARSNQCLE